MSQSNECWWIAFLSTYAVDIEYNLAVEQDSPAQTLRPLYRIGNFKTDIDRQG
jgi:hypothetical protein